MGGFLEVRVPLIAMQPLRKWIVIICSLIVICAGGYLMNARVTCDSWATGTGFFVHNAWLVRLPFTECIREYNSKLYQCVFRKMPQSCTLLPQKRLEHLI